ncbi:hypothetical protein HK097_004803 [Rhizophlyctis rosea]|uniref:Uncharacterized protein n=1 Tax=Rhizophlyctis rosea TaxID=64517 RepID=A0AAD5SF98_9FUNG|nr:hypothetical protein HK097_004803 [Rhizophlyctis rosea]
MQVPPRSDDRRASKADIYRLDGTESEHSDEEFAAPEEQPSRAPLDLGSSSSLSTNRVIVVSLFLPTTVNFEVPPTPGTTTTKTVERRKSVAEGLRRRRVSEAGRIDRLAGGKWKIEPSALGNIGLQNAVASMKNVMRERLWVGTLGESMDNWDEITRARVEARLRMENDSVPVFVSDDEFDGHYNKFCKQILWKPFHYRLPDYPKGQAYEELAWRQYVAVNQKFANVIAENHKTGDIVWINDYHLMLVPAMVRQLIPNAMIGFFLHIPFPSSEIFRCLHVRRQILEGLLGADLIGFQTSAFMRHFLMTCTRLLSLESTPRGIQLDNRAVSVGIFPIGINIKALKEKRYNFSRPTSPTNQSLTKSLCRNVPPVEEAIHSLRERYAGKKIVIGRDKNDYVKGVRQKMLAFERFLQKNPEWVGKVVLIQVALSTTEANENESMVWDVVARINAGFGTIEYQPVVYLQQDIRFEDYLALLTIADACLITSLRDGMNLTSHEYVICQEGKYGPLIMSEFAGTYASFGAALRVNPWDTQEVADAILEGLTMDESEKKTRWNELYAYISSNSAQHYVESFTGEVLKVHDELARSVSTSIPPLPVDVVYNEYMQANRRIFFLDQDGTIMTFNRHSSSTTPLTRSIPTDRAIDMLQNLAVDPKNTVYVMSGRTREDLEELMDIPNLGLCAENGSFVKYADRSKWETMLPDQDFSWMRDVLEIFEYYTDRTPGSYIEQKETTLVWHFGRADLNFSTWQAAECHNHIEQSLGTNYAIHVLAKKRSVEVMPRNINKGIIIRRVLEHHQVRSGTLKRSKSQRAQTPVDGVDSSVGPNGSEFGHQKKMSFSEGVESIEVKALERGDSSVEVTPVPSDAERNVSGNNQMSPHHNHEQTHHVPKKERIDFIFCVGDDRADEYMFEYLRRLEAHSRKRHASRMQSGGKDLSGHENLSGTLLGDDGHGEMAMSPGTITPGRESPTSGADDTTADDHLSVGTGAISIPSNRSDAGKWDAYSVSLASASPSGSPSDRFTPHSHSRSPSHHHSHSHSHHNHYHHVFGHHHHHHHHHHHQQRRPRTIVTATVGRKSSAAKWFVSGAHEVLGLLEALAEVAEGGGERGQ